MVTNNQNQAKATVDTNSIKPVASTSSTANVVNTKTAKAGTNVSNASSSTNSTSTMSTNSSSAQVVDHSNLDNAVKNAESVKVNVQQGTAEKQPDGTYKYVTSTHTENAVNVKQTATQNVNDKQTAEKDYQSQADNINKTTDQAKQNVQDYENKVNAQIKQNQQNVDNYNQTKKTVDSNNASLQSEASSLKSQGVNVTQDSSVKKVSNVQDAQSDYQVNKAKLDAAAKQQAANNEAYQKAEAQYENQLKVYNALMQKSDITKANNITPIIDGLAWSATDNGTQPKVSGDIEADKNNEHTYDENDKTGDKLWGDTYGSQKVWSYVVANKDATPIKNSDGTIIGWNDPATINVEYDNVATDANGRKLNMTYTLSNFVVASAMSDARSVENNVPSIEVFSNPRAGIEYNNIAAMRVKINLTYADDGSEYNGPIAVKIGGLNKKRNQNIYEKGKVIGYTAGASQYVTPVSNVNAVYRDSQSLVSADEQSIDGVANTLDKAGYRIANNVNQNGPVGAIDSSFTYDNGLGWANSNTNLTMNSDGQYDSVVNNQTSYLSWDLPYSARDGQPTITVTHVADQDVNVPSDLESKLGTDWTSYFTVTKGKDSEGNDCWVVAAKPELISLFKQLPDDASISDVTCHGVYRYQNTNNNAPYDNSDDAFKQVGITMTGTNGLTYDIGDSAYKVVDTASASDIKANDDDYKNIKRQPIYRRVPCEHFVTEVVPINTVAKPTKQNVSVSYNLDDVEAPTTSSLIPYQPTDVDYHYDQLVSHEGTPKPVKHVDDTQGQQIDENFVKQGQELDYKVSWDLSGDQNVEVSDQMKTAGLGIEDTIDSRLTPKVSGVKVTDAKGNVINNNEFNITDDNGTIKIMAKDPQAFINQYQGQTLSVTIPTTVNENVTGDIPNEAIEDHFGNQVKTNIVKVYIPAPHKDVEAGTIDGANIKQSVDGKQVIKGEAITFPLTTSALPAGREEDIKSYVVTDKLDSNFDYSSCKAFLDGKDVTNMYTIKNDNGTLTLTANDDLLKLMNDDKSKDFQMPIIDIYGSAKASGVTIKNQYIESFNNKAYESNTVSVHTPESPKPTKNVDDANGNNIEAHFVSQDQPVNFTIGFDLTQDKDLVLDSASVAKGLDIEDDIDDRLNINTDGIVVKDAKGNVIDKKDFTITNDNNHVMIKVNDPQAFINQYGEQMLSVMIPTTTKTGVTGDIYNTAVENHFGDKEKTNQVVVYIPAPHKDVLAGTVQGTSSNSIDGKNVVKGQAITFPLTTSALPAGRQEDVKSYVIKDTLDSNFKYDSFQAFSNGKDVTSEFIPALTQGQDGKWTLTLTATDQLLKEMNADKSKAFDIPVVDLYGSANASGVTIKNDYQEILNGHDYQSNTVTVHTTPAEKPTKEVDDAQGDNIDNDNVEDGDMLNYKVTMDLSGLKEATLTPDTIAKGLSIIDTLPTGVTLQQGAIKVTTSDGKTDLTNMFDVTVSGNQVTVAAKDSARLVVEYGDQKLIVTLPSQVNDGFTGDLTNIAEQNTFGNIEKTNQVVNHVPNIKPDKDVVIDTLSKDSLNNQTVKYGQTFDYKLLYHVRKIMVEQQHHGKSLTICRTKMNLLVNIK